MCCCLTNVNSSTKIIKNKKIKILKKEKLTGRKCSNEGYYADIYKRNLYT